MKTKNQNKTNQKPDLIQLQKLNLIRQQKLNKLEKYKNILPELNNCDKLINKWSKELMTIFPKECRKDWKEGRHLIVNKRGYTEYLLSTLSVGQTDNQKILGLIEEGKLFPSSLIILEGKLNSNEVKLYYWKDRYNEFKYYRIEKNDDNSFIISHWYKDEYKKEIRPYRNFIENNIITGIKDFDTNKRFIEMSLVSDCIQKTRKKGASNGAKKSNKNSSVQKLRRGKKVELEFDCPYGNNKEIKDMLDSYKIAVSYGFKGVYRTFVRQLYKGEIKLQKTGDLGDILICKLLGVSTPALNYIYTDKNLKNLNLNENSPVKVGVDTPKDKKLKTDNLNINKNNKKEKCMKENEKREMSYTKEDIIENDDFENYKEWCKDIPEENQWTFEEYLNFKKTAK